MKMILSIFTIMMSLYVDAGGHIGNGTGGSCVPAISCYDDQHQTIILPVQFLDDLMKNQMFNFQECAVVSCTDN